MVSRDLVPMVERMRRATVERQAARDCGCGRAGHNGALNRAIGGSDDQPRNMAGTMIFRRNYCFTARAIGG